LRQRDVVADVIRIPKLLEELGARRGAGRLHARLPRRLDLDEAASGLPLELRPALGRWPIAIGWPYARHANAPIGNPRIGARNKARSRRCEPGQDSRAP